MQLSITFLLMGAMALAGTTTAKMQCSPHIVAAATGIHLNIVGQEAELASIKALQKIEAGMRDHDYNAQFGILKGELIAKIEIGQSIRAFNQKVLPAKNGATAGLATVKGAQMTELGLAKSLTGDAKHDHKILATLSSDVENGTAQNKKNLAAAIHGCKLGINLSS